MPPLSALTNLPHLTAMRSAARSRAQVETSMVRLATGQRINAAKDDPAGMTAAENLKAEERSLKARIEGLEEQRVRLAARDGAESVVHDLVIDLRTVILAASNRGGVSDAELDALQIEADSIIEAINFLGNTSQFRGEQLLGGRQATSMGVITYAGEGDQGPSSVSLQDISAGGKLNLRDGDLETAFQVADGAASSLAAARGYIGAQSQQVESDLRQAMTELENTTAARSNITDTDFASETAELVRSQLLESAGLFMTKLAMDMQKSLVVNLLAPAAKT